MRVLRHENEAERIIDNEKNRLLLSNSFEVTLFVAWLCQFVLRRWVAKIINNSLDDILLPALFAFHWTRHVVAAITARRGEIPINFIFPNIRQTEMEVFIKLHQPRRAVLPSELSRRR